MKQTLAQKIAKAVNQKVYHGVQMFNSRNISGDYMEVIWTCYQDPSITVEYAPGWDYVEVLGLDDETYKEVYRLTHSEV